MSKLKGKFFPIEMMTAQADKYISNFSKLGIEYAWAVNKGKGSVVAVLDSGINLTKSDFQGQILDCKNFYDGSTDYSDKVNHGTSVAGLIAAKEGENDFVGIAPQSKLIIGKVADKNGTDIQIEHIVEATKWATNWVGPNGEKVKAINMSFGFTVTDETTAEELAELELLRGVISEAINAGISVVAAAGNSGDNSTETEEIDYPAAWSEVISVGANMGSTPTLAPFTNTNDQIDLTAPGVSLWCVPNDNRAYAIQSGTSVSAPIVSGALALIYSAYEAVDQPLTEQEAFDILIKDFTQDNTAIDSKGEGHGSLTFKKKILPIPADWVAPPAVTPQSNEIQHALNYIGVRKAWLSNYGRDIVIASLSTGIDVNHESFMFKILEGKNFTTENNGDVTNFADTNGIGTGVAALMAGRSGVGHYVGVAPEANLIVGKVQKSDLTFDIAKAVEAIDWAINWRGSKGEKVRVIHSTFHTTTDDVNLKVAVQRAEEEGIVFVSGSANESKVADYYPASYHNVISVASVNFASSSLSSNDQVTYSSARNNNISFAAPGYHFDFEMIKRENGSSISISDKNTDLASSIVAGGIAIIIKGYESQGIMLSNKAMVLNEILQKFIRTNSRNAALEVGAGIFDFNINYLPGTAPGETKIEYIEVPVEKIVYVDNGRGKLIFKTDNGIVKADFGREKAISRRFEK